MKIDTRLMIAIAAALVLLPFAAAQSKTTLQDTNTDPAIANNTFNGVGLLMHLTRKRNRTGTRWG